MKKEASRPKEREPAKSGFAGREVLAELASVEKTGTFSLEQLRAAAADGLHCPVSGQDVKDVLAAIPRPKTG